MSRSDFKKAKRPRYQGETEAEQENIITIIDEAGAYTYIGNSYASASASESVWKVRRITEANPLRVEFASGSAEYVNIWNNRATLDYS
ncbi:hypothetical protein HYV49_03485 [Candidatus Pacearchaeota archaeon]|nr:hypothetical protein [Candidatus Pacearchaeota archaeon]